LGFAGAHPPRLTWERAPLASRGSAPKTFRPIGIKKRFFGNSEMVDTAARSEAARHRRRWHDELVHRSFSYWARACTP